MTIPARVNLVTLGVTDLARSTAFYEALGWRRSAASQESIAFLATGGCVVALFPVDDLAADVTVPVPDTIGFRGVTLAINLPSEADVTAAIDEASAAGATLLKEPQKVEWGGFSGYFADPDGHAWEVAYNPFWPLADDGSVVLPPPAD